MYRIMNAISTDEPNLWEWINSLAILFTNLPVSWSCAAHHYTIQHNVNILLGCLVGGLPFSCECKIF